MNDSPVTLFIPLGNDRSNAGLTLRAETTAEVAASLNDLLATDGTEESRLSDILNGVATIKAAVELILPSSTPAPQAKVTHPQAQSAPSDAPSCAHGPMKWKEGVGKSSGKPYKGWFCAAPFGQTQCEARFVK